MKCKNSDGKPEHIPEHTYDKIVWARNILDLPEYFGQDFPFKVISIYQYLDEQIQNGNLQISR